MQIFTTSSSYKKNNKLLLQYKNKKIQKIKDTPYEYLFTINPLPLGVGVVICFYHFVFRCLLSLLLVFF